MYCNATSKKMGLDTAYTFNSISSLNAANLQCNLNVKAVRLPTEDEWEMAARAGKKLLYATDDGTLSCTKVNYGDCALNKPAIVGSYAANPYGIKDMTGNVGEWCWDIYNSPRLAMQGQYTVNGRVDYAYSTNVGFGIQTRVYRGGDFQETNSGRLQTGSRRGYGPTTYNGRLGFRCVIPLKQPH